MGLIVEGFERMALGQAPLGGTYLSRPFDGLGWQVSSGTYADGSGGLIEVVGAGPGVDRGRGLKFIKSASVGSGPWIAGAGVKIPDNGWTKRVIAFFLHTDPTEFGSNGWQPLFFATTSAFAAINRLSVAYLSTTNQICLYGLSTSYAVSLVPGSRTHVELHYDRTARTLSLYVNGQFAHSLAGIVATDFNAFEMFYINAAYGSAYLTRPFIVDDFYMIDDTEGDTAESLGPCKVDLGVPTATVETGFTPNTAVAGNYESVGEIPINESTFVSAATLGVRDLHTVANPLAGRPSEDRVIAVQSQVLAKSNPASEQATAAVGIGGQFVKATVTAGAETTLIKATAWENPATSQPLTIADLDTLQTGYSVGPTF